MACALDGGKVRNKSALQADDNLYIFFKKRRELCGGEREINKIVRERLCNEALHIKAGCPLHTLIR